MTTIKKLKREAQKLAEEQGHLMDNFRKVDGGDFQANCRECSMFMMVGPHDVTGRLRYDFNAHVTKCPGMEIKTTKAELVEIFTAEFDRCRVPRSVSTPNHMLHGFDRGSAPEVLAAVIGSAYCAGFLWARHQCGTHPDYVIQPE